MGACAGKPNPAPGPSAPPPPSAPATAVSDSLPLENQRPEISNGVRSRSDEVPAAPPPLVSLQPTRTSQTADPGPVESTGPAPSAMAMGAAEVAALPSSGLAAMSEAPSSPRTKERIAQFMSPKAQVHVAPLPLNTGAVSSKHAGLAAAILENAAQLAEAQRQRRKAVEVPTPSGGAGVGGTGEEVPPLDKKFGYSKNLSLKYELEQEIGRGHFGHTCLAKVKKGERKGATVAVKIIPKAKMTSAVAIDDVRREVKILHALAGYEYVVNFYDAYEDPLHVYIAMELCEGGELLERILQRGGRFSEAAAIVVVRQVLSIVAFCHQQGVVHRDLKPENFLFKTRDEYSPIRAIDFGLSDFIKPDQRLNDIVGSAYYIAPEVLHRSYATEADVWSVGVISYVLLCGSRPFWARTESGIFRSVLKLEPSFSDLPWPSLSQPAKEFVKGLLNKDLRRRPTAAQALTHPWVRGGGVKVPLDPTVFKCVRSFCNHSELRRAGLRALVKTLTEDDLIYLRAQFNHLDVKGEGVVSYDNFKQALYRVATDAMRESFGLDILNTLDPHQVKNMSMEEFCAAALNVFYLEGKANWGERANLGYDFFNANGNRVVTRAQLAKEMGSGVDVRPEDVALEEWTNSDGTLSFLGFARLVHGPSRSRQGKRGGESKGGVRRSQSAKSSSSKGRGSGPGGEGSQL